MTSVSIFVGGSHITSYKGLFEAFRGKVYSEIFDA
jgi:hypothetical protein